jgi:hypothetical protein
VIQAHPLIVSLGAVAVYAIAHLAVCAFTGAREVSHE